MRRGPGGSRNKQRTRNAATHSDVLAQYDADRDMFGLDPFGSVDYLGTPMRRSSSPTPIEVVVIEEGAAEGQEAVEGQEAGAAAEGVGPAQAMDVEKEVEKEEVSGGGGEAGRSVDLSIDEDSDEEPVEPGPLTQAWNKLEARASQMKPGDPVCDIGRSPLRD